MLYAFPILIALMLSYMFWLAGVSMRRDRIQTSREKMLSRSNARSGPASSEAETTD